MAADKVDIFASEEEKLAAGRHEQWLKSQPAETSLPTSPTSSGKAPGTDKNGADKITATHAKAQSALPSTSAASSGKAHVTDKEGTDKTGAIHAKAKSAAGASNKGTHKAKEQATHEAGKANGKAKASPKAKVKTPGQQAMWDAAQNAGDTSKSRLAELKKQQKLLQEQGKRARMDEFNERRRRQRIIDRCISISDEDMMTCLTIRAEMRAERDARAEAQAAAAALAGVDEEGEEEEVQEEKDAEADSGEEDDDSDDGKEKEDKAGEGDHKK